MSVSVNDIYDELKKFAPVEYKENFDNVGLLVGKGDEKVRKVLAFTENKRYNIYMQNEV